MENLFLIFGIGPIALFALWFIYKEFESVPMNAGELYRDMEDGSIFFVREAGDVGSGTFVGRGIFGDYFSTMSLMLGNDRPSKHVIHLEGASDVGGLKKGLKSGRYKMIESGIDAKLAQEIAEEILLN